LLHGLEKPPLPIKRKPRSEKTKSEAKIAARFAETIRDLAKLADAYDLELSNGAYVDALLMAIADDLEEQVKEGK
jgi:hypothetical protein